MIKLQNYTPQVYYNESRDFQYIGRLFDVILNAVKTKVDIVYNIPSGETIPDTYLDLLAYTLGFKTNHKYTSVQLRAICKVFPLILRNKGNVQALITACNTLLNAEGITASANYEITTNDFGMKELNLYIPEDFSNIPLISDLLGYVLPAGMSCNIIQEMIEKETINTNVGVSSNFTIYSGGTEGATYNGNAKVKYSNNTLATIYNYDPTTNDNAKSNSIKDNSGFIATGTIYKPTE